MAAGVKLKLGKDEFGDNISANFLELMEMPRWPVVDREKEVEDLLDVLYKQRMRNVCLVGPAGCGKTELVREVARQAKSLGWTFYQCNLSTLVGGTTFRGELERRIDESFRKISTMGESKIAIFCDEAHLLYGAGETAAEGVSMTVGQMLKPYLSSGKVVIWGATTPGEWEESFGKDSALSRRMPRKDISELGREGCLTAFKNFIRSSGVWNGKSDDVYVEKIYKECGGSLEAGIERIDCELAHIRRCVCK